MATYQVLSWQDFCHQLIETGDLDPVYIMLHRAQLDERLLKSWLLAYWCFYSCDTASRIADEPTTLNDARDYWYKFELALKSKWPRGAERRHYRGNTAQLSFQDLKKFGNPEEIVDFMVKGPTFHEIQQRVKLFYGFGPWVTWKIADMAERVFLQGCSLSLAYVFRV